MKWVVFEIMRKLWIEWIQEEYYNSKVAYYIHGQYVLSNDEMRFNWTCWN